VLVKIYLAVLALLVSVSINMQDLSAYISRVSAIFISASDWTTDTIDIEKRSGVLQAS